MAKPTNYFDSQASPQGASPFTGIPQPDGVGNPGALSEYSRGDHAHPGGGGSSLIVLSGELELYVDAATGVDSTVNPLQGFSLGLPFATIGFAYRFAQSRYNFDGNELYIYLNSNGSSSLFGSLLNSNGVTIEGVNGTEVLAELNSVDVDGLTISSVICGVISINQGVRAALNAVTFNKSAHVYAGLYSSGCEFLMLNTVIFDGSGGAFYGEGIRGMNGSRIYAPGSISFVNGVVFPGAFLLCEGASAFYLTSGQFTGSFTGRTFSVDATSGIYGLDLATIPGTIFSVYNGLSQSFTPTVVGDWTAQPINATQAINDLASRVRILELAP